MFLPIFDLYWSIDNVIALHHRNNSAKLRRLVGIKKEVNATCKNYLPQFVYKVKIIPVALLAYPEDISNKKETKDRIHVILFIASHFKIIRTLHWFKIKLR